MSWRKPSYLWPSHAWVGSLSLDGRDRKCSPDPDLEYGRRSLPPRPESNSRKDFKPWIIYVVMPWLLTWSFYFWTTRANRSTGVFLEPPSVRVGRTFHCCRASPLYTQFLAPSLRFHPLQQFAAPLFPLPRTWYITSADARTQRWVVCDSQHTDSVPPLSLPFEVDW